MTRIMMAIVAAAFLGAATPAAADEGSADGPGAGGATKEFLGIDLDTGGVYYNGRNSGRYCVYRTVEVFNRATGYLELRRLRSCGRGLYVR